MLKNVNIIKVLTQNDVGLTGSGQEGITIPKRDNFLDYFPSLNKNILNPREEILFKDRFERDWHFGFVYYNNKFFGGTRNEYRLSKTKAFIKKYKLTAGDAMIFKINNSNKRIIDFYNKKGFEEKKNKVILLTNNWYTMRL